MRNGIRMLAAVFAAFAVPYLFLTQPGNASQQNPAASETEEYSQQYRYTLRDYNGLLAIFEENNTTPVQTFDVFTNSLPQEDAERVKNGIGADNEEELQHLIEDYTS